MASIAPKLSLGTWHWMIITVSVVLSGDAHALPQRVDISEVVRDPKLMVGRDIRLASAKCASEPSGKYACRIEKSGGTVRVESLSLSFKTSSDVRRKLVSRCTASLDKVEGVCVFDIEIKIAGVRLGSTTSATSSEVILTARTLDLFSSKSP